MIQFLGEGSERKMQELYDKMTPMMQQYLDVKKDYQDTILFYRIGDFYEMFFEDALVASKALEITLTGKDCGLEERAPMCGVPHHSAQLYVSKLIHKGFKVAICEQLEDPSLAKGLVKRDVTRIITPGTVTESNMLDDKKNNFIASLYRAGIYYGFAYADISTGEFYTTEATMGNNYSKIIDEIARVKPAEIVVNPEMANDEKQMTLLKEKYGVYVTVREESHLEIPIEGFLELNQKEYAKEATQILLTYLQETQKTELKHITRIENYEITSYMILDSVARKNLELTETIKDKNKKGSLLWVLDKTSTAMGGRLLRRWIEEPLMDIKEIQYRQEGVGELKQNLMLRGDIFEALKSVYDIERLTGKVAYGNVNARDLISLKNSLQKLPVLKSFLQNTHSKILQEVYEQMDILEDVTKLIEEAIVEDPPLTIKEGGIIKTTYNEDVQKYRTASTEGKTWVLNLEAKERELTGIKNLKVGYNKVFGYYIEISKSNVGMAPERYIRKQTLTNGERYITEELKEIENTILGAEDKVVKLEFELFNQVRETIAKEVKRLKQTSNAVSTLDVLNTLAEDADTNQYVMPVVDNSGEIVIQEGRHPVVEALIPNGSFVPNDTYLNQKEDRVNIITGPNMAGKSTYMRQVALIVLMAQIGSFVPATSAKIGIVDRIFTRVGASDDLSTGQSTFMVEMNEVANIVSNATKDSLLILDEIGRGTSTFDGLSIAWSVVEYIANNEKIGARTLFATHYHELTELEGEVPGVKNYCIDVKEKGEDIIFLRKIIRGGADESYGVHVAKLAGIPHVITARANEILKGLKESSYIGKHEKELAKISKEVAPQMDLFNYKVGEIATELDKINVNELTPVEALNVLVKLKEKL